MSSRTSLKASRTPGSARTGAMAHQMAARSQQRKLVRFIPRSLPASFTHSTTIGKEIKAIDLTYANQLFRTPGTATNVILLNGVQTGAAFYNRVGSRIEMKNLHIRGYINNAATAIATQGRMLIVYDRQPTGALPTIQNLLQTRDQTGATSNTHVSEINLDNRDRFMIVRDVSFYFPPVTNTAGVLTNGPSYPALEDSQFDVNIFIRLKGLVTHFSSSSNPTTIADIATGGLYAFFVAGQDSTWQWTGGFRLRYDDL